MIKAAARADKSIYGNAFRKEMLLWKKRAISRVLRGLSKRSFADLFEIPFSYPLYWDCLQVFAVRTSSYTQRKDA